MKNLKVIERIHWFYRLLEANLIFRTYFVTYEPSYQD